MNKAIAKKLLGQERVRLEKIREGVYDELGDPSEDGMTMSEVSGTDQHPADAGTERFEREKDMSIIANLDAELVEVQAALRRLELDGYGTCELCGRPIGEARLKVRPATRFCVKDQATVERQARAAAS